jgi:hypothetical protein
MTGTHSLNTLYVDSRYAVQGGSSSFKLDLSRPLVVKDGVRMRIDHVRFTDTFPIISGSNRYLYFANGGSYSRYEVAPGAYSASELAAAIQAATGYVTTYNARENNLTINNTHPMLTDAQVIAMGVSTPNSMNSTLGLGTLSQVGADYTFFAYVNMQPYQEAFLRSRTLQVHGSHGHAKEEDILCAIPLTGGFLSIVNYSMPDTLWHVCRHMNLSHLDFQLTDRDSKPLELHSSLAFQVSFDD